MAKYRKKPVVVEVEAFKLGIDYIPDWFMDRVSDKSVRIFGSWKHLDFCHIDTSEGVQRGDRGDFIIRGAGRELYVCKPDLFEAVYERIEAPITIYN